MPSSQENNETITTFTLSFGGIEFCLSPSSAVSRSSNDDDDDYVDDAARRAAVMSIAKIRDGEVSIDLNGFVGTLRVWDRNAVVRADVVVAATTEKSPIIGRNDDEDDDRRTRSGAGGLTSSSRDDGTSNAAAAAVAAEAAPPNPVEDTPSPNAKGRAVGGGEEADEEEEEEKPAKADGGRRKKGQQQKLDFFGRNGNKRGRVASKVSERCFFSFDSRMTNACPSFIVCAIRFSLAKNFVFSRHLKNQAPPHPSVAPTQRESSIRKRKLPTEGRSPARATRRRRMRHRRQTTTLQSSKISSKRSRRTTTRARAMH